MATTLPRPTAIILAAGLSRRAAPHNKLLLPVGNRTVVRATVEAFRAGDFSEVIVVTGHECGRVEHALAGLPVRFVRAPDFARGMGHSLAAGVRAAAPEARGFVVSPGDLPGLTPSLVRRIVAHFAREVPPRHIIPAANGARGHPVVLGAWLRLSLESLSGDSGARTLLASPEESSRCVFLEVDDEAILHDVDSSPTP